MSLLQKKTWVIGYLREKDIPSDLVEDVGEFFEAKTDPDECGLPEIVVANFEEDIEETEEGEWSPGLLEFLNRVILEARRRKMDGIKLNPYED